MEVKATAKYVRVSPRKARIVIDQIRGKDVVAARDILRFSERAIAETVEKVLNTSDLLPTVLNLMGVESPYDYIGRDAFDPEYDGFVPFSNGSWIYGDAAYDASAKKYLSISGKQQTVSAELQQTLAERVQDFIRVNNLILEADYYH